MLIVLGNEVRYPSLYTKCTNRLRDNLDTELNRQESIENWDSYTDIFFFSFLLPELFSVVSAQ